MNHDNPHRRTAGAFLAAAGLLFAIFPLVRPFSPDGGADALDQFGSHWWTVAHLAGAAAFIATAFAFAALHRAPLATTAIGLGSALTLMYFGAETFALHQLTAVDDETARELAELIRSGAPQMIVFGVGLVLVAVGVAVALATAVRARLASVLPAGLLAAGYVLYIPQFFMPPTLRIAHGMLMLVGCLWVAYGLVEPGPAENTNAALDANVAEAPGYSERSTTTGA